MDATTELKLWEKDTGGSLTPVDIGSVTGQGNTGITTSHIFNLINLSPDTLYRAEARSYDDVSADYMPCDDGSSPIEFTTLVSQQPAVIGSITVTSAKQQIAVGENVEISARVFDSNGTPMQNVTVEFSAKGAFSWLFFWLPPIGSVNPQKVQTDAGGEAKTVFTAARKGIAIIKAKAGSVESKTTVIIG